MVECAAADPMCTSWIWEFSVLGGFEMKIFLFCSSALCGTAGALWMCFHYQNNLLSKNKFRCCSPAVGLSQKSLKRISLPISIFSPQFFLISNGNFDNFFTTLDFWVSSSLRSRIAVNSKSWIQSWIQNYPAIILVKK